MEIQENKVVQAREWLKKAEVEQCVKCLEDFFMPLGDEPIMKSLRNQLWTLQSQFALLNRDRDIGVILNEEYYLRYNRISNALFAFFDSLLDEGKRIKIKDRKSTSGDEKSTINIILVLNERYETFTDEDARNMVNKLRTILRLKEHDFTYLSKKKGSVLIEVNAKRDYSLVVRLKSIVKIKIIKNLTSVQVQDYLMDTLCISFVNINLDLSEISLLNASFKETNLSSANFEKASLFNANFNRANLNDANFKSAILIGADFEESSLYGANFENAKLRRIDIIDSYHNLFIEYKFLSANLVGAYVLNTKFSLIYAKYLISQGLDINKCIFIDELGGEVTKEELIPVE